MAETVDVTGVDGTPDSTSDSVELSSEQRDEATIARTLGTDRSQNADDAAATDAPDDAAVTTDDEADEEGETAADDELPEVTDEDLENILDALDDRLLAHPRIQKVLEEKAKADADRRYEERRQAESVGQESERLIRQGRTAVDNVYTLFTKLDGELQKAIRGDDVDGSVKFDRDALMSELGAFGAAAVAEARTDSDRAFAQAFREGAQLGGDMTEEEKASVIKIVQTAQRIANDPAQGSGASLGHLFKENIKFLVDRAKKAGAAEAEASFSKRRAAMEKVVGTNGTKAAVAKLANTRKNLPTKPTTVPAQAAASGGGMEAYKAAKAAGDYARADEIMAEMR